MLVHSLLMESTKRLAPDVICTSVIHAGLVHDVTNGLPEKKWQYSQMCFHNFQTSILCQTRSQIDRRPIHINWASDSLLEVPFNMTGQSHHCSTLKHRDIKWAAYAVQTQSGNL